MSYSGNQPIYGTFPSDLFTGNGSNTVFTMSSVPGNDAALLVTIDGVRQHTDTYSYSANTLTFSEAPGNGAIIETVNMGSRADVIITEGVYKKTQFTATAAQTNFTIPTGYTVGFVDVYLNGIRLVVADDYTATDGSTIILATPAANGDSVEVVAYGTFNVANALLKSGDTMSGNLVVSGTSTLMAPVAIANTTGNTFVIANTGAVTVTGTANVSGAVAFSNTLSVASNTLLGTTTTTNNLRLNQKLAVVTTGSGIYGGASLTSYPGTVNVSSIIDLQRSRGTTDGSMTAVASGDILGYGPVFRGADGTNFVDAAYIQGAVDGTVSTGIVPGRLTFNTSNASGANQEVMRMDSSGRVTMPYQPAFHAYSGAGQSGNNVVIAYSTTSYNNGNCYSTSTNRFTAPISGTYCFSATFMNGGLALTARWGLQKNGTTYGNELYGMNNTYFRSNGMWVVPMSTNDYVTIVAGLPGTPCDIHSEYRHFSGYLIG